MKSYTDRGVQAGSPLLQSCILSLDPEIPSPSPEHPSFANGDPHLSPLAAPLQTSRAYSYSRVHSSPFTRTEASRATKPRGLPQLRPPTTRHSAIRVVSLPEDSLSATGKFEHNLVQRVVSMPEQRLAGGQLAESSFSTEGFDSSMMSGGSFLSGTDTTSDSVLIIENNCGLSEAFLSNQNTTKSGSPVSEEKIAPSDEGWITWAKSPPRPIPCTARAPFFTLCALPIVSRHHSSSSILTHTPLSGAEGTVIEEPDNLPRVIWGLDSEEHSLGDLGSDANIKKQEITTQSLHHFRHSPRHYESEKDISAAATRTHATTVTMHSPRRSGPDDTDYCAVPPAMSGSRTDLMYSRHPYNEAIVLENLVDRRTTRGVNGYDAIGNLTRTLEHNLHMRESDFEHHTNDILDRNILPRAYGSRNSLTSSRSSLPAMRVSSRPAVGSALPQILIEPRSPENHQTSSRRMTAIELAHQFQQHQLLKMQQQSLLPTPPNSSSPLWSSDFSPYSNRSVSPASLRHQVVQAQLRDSEVSDRHLARERLGRSIVHDSNPSPLAPAPLINSASRLNYPGYDLDPVTSQALTNLLATQDVQHLSPLSSEVLLPVTRAPQTLPEYIGRDTRRYAVPRHDTLLSPSSPEYPQGLPQPHIARSIPLARLMQRRLSSVPEEDSSPTIHGRSPSPRVMRNGADRPYLYPPVPRENQYAEMFALSNNCSGPYSESASRGLQGKLRGSVFGGRSSTVGMDTLDVQGRYRARHEGGTSEKDVVQRRAGGLKKTRGRSPKFHGN
ncbi:hypothetical protein F5148DRAFT_1242708 [Russula earlei]|uniref:Uncharacterized protein n=1 Tax=Russula earlei TaxID=71964 RepID=A0ACC0TV84_9AGAM|nr:hypothetical protein F5148DRAFT_1242708 [Russula earlei]